MRRQPKYNFFSNTFYALKGICDLIKTERSFQIELALFICLLPVIVLIDENILSKIVMFISLIGVLIAETINSAIERTVDLVTLEHNEMAGRAKNVGSAIVFLSSITALVSWFLILI